MNLMNNCNLFRNNQGNQCNKEKEEHRHDRGKEPHVVNICQATLRNQNFRTALWTGCELQLTVMCIPVGEEIGLEMHPTTDQFLCIEQGQGIVKMGSCKEKMCFEKCVSMGDAIFIPECTWHNIINTGKCPLKLYSIYAPPEHPCGTVHKTRKEAMEAER